MAASRSPTLGPRRAARRSGGAGRGSARRVRGPATGAAKPRGAGAGRVGPRSRRDRQARDGGGGELGEGWFPLGEVIGEEAGLPLAVVVDGNPGRVPIPSRDATLPAKPAGSARNLDQAAAEQVAQKPSADDLEQVRHGDIRDARQGVEHGIAHEDSIQHERMKVRMKFQVGGNPLHDGHGTALAAGGGGLVPGENTGDFATNGAGNASNVLVAGCGERMEEQLAIRGRGIDAVERQGVKMDVQSQR
jgi:hypothetical protein